MPTDSSSASGEAITCGFARVCWIFIAQKYDTLSTSEAEYVALDKSLIFVVAEASLAFHVTR